ncbi:hypothetical protein AKO1_001658, partial [Acrasis kona]
ERLWVTSRILSASEDTDSTKRNASVLQEFILPPNQRIRGFLHRDQSRPFDGAYVYTQDSLFRLSPKISPVDTFTRVALSGDLHSADRFGKTFGLDLYQLYQSCADDLYQKNQIDLSLKLYSASNVDKCKIARKLIECGRLESAIYELNQALETPENYSVNQRRELSDLTFLCYLYHFETNSPPLHSNQHLDQITNLEYYTCKEPTPNSNSNLQPNARDSNQYLRWGLGNSHSIHFRHFLNCQSLHGDPNLICEQLIKRGLIDLCIEYAHGHIRSSSTNHNQSQSEESLIEKILKMACEMGFVNLSYKCYLFLLDWNYVNETIKIHNGTLLNGIQNHDLKLQFLIRYLHHLRNQRGIDNLSNSRFRSDSNLSNSSHLTIYDDLESTSVSPAPSNLVSPPSPRININKFGYFENDPSSEFHKSIRNLLFELITITSNPNGLTKCLQFFSASNTIGDARQEDKARWCSPEHYYPYLHVNDHVELMLLAHLKLINLNQNDADHNLSLQFTLEELINRYGNPNHKICKFRREWLLMQCMRYNNRNAAAVIYEVQHCRLDALTCRLRQFQESNGGESEVLSLLDRYIINDSDDDQDVALLQRFFSFWRQKKLPPSQLQSTLMNHMTRVGSALSEMVLRREDFPIGFDRKFYLALCSWYVARARRSQGDQAVSSDALRSQIIKNIDKEIDSKFVKIKCQDGMTDSIGFSCGHFYDQVDFYEKMIPELRRRLGGGFEFEMNKIENLNEWIENHVTDARSFIVSCVLKLVERDYELLRDYPKNPKFKTHVCQQACPVCVHNYLCKGTKQQFWN